MTTLAEFQTELAEVKVAIKQIQEGGQSYSIDGRQMTRANLETLLASRAWLELQIKSFSRGGKPGMQRAIFS